MSKGYCPYCSVEDSNGIISDIEGEKDLFEYKFVFLGEDLAIYGTIDQGRLKFFNFDFNPFYEMDINYCPMCGRKLDHWEFD